MVDVAFGKMVASVDGTPWESTIRAVASPGFFGGEGLYVLGLGDSVQIAIHVSSTPRVGTYSLANEHATCSVLTSRGWISFYTQGPYTGSAYVTRVDSTSIEGVFAFDGLGDDPPRIHRIRAGEFNVPIESLSATDWRRTDSKRVAQ